MAYEQTDVAVEKSQAEVRKLLYAHGARNFSFSETEVDGISWAAVDFIHHDQRVRIRVALKALDANELNARARRAVSRTRSQIEHEMREQEGRRIWRVLFHGLKARLVSVQEGVETFEEAFLAHLVDPVSGMTMWDALRGAVEDGALRSGGPGLNLAQLALGSGPAAADDDVVEAEVVA